MMLSCGAGGECGVPTHYRYRMPTPDPVEEAKYWYSFDHGPVHYIAYSTELHYAAGSEQNTCALPTGHLTPAKGLRILVPFLAVGALLHCTATYSRCAPIDMSRILPAFLT